MKRLFGLVTAVVATLVLLLPILPASLIIAMLRMLDATGFKLPVKAEPVQRLNEDKDFFHEEAARDFGYAPKSFKEGISFELSEMGLLKKSDLKGMLWAD